ncbi:2Fe-2S iron-sulfur cluster-binding protein [Paracraurococcus lichenis]|uniref:2Fe-2S iron-sulfur cluster-binding protein n=1 Tax=Paracraurococcus lichenis TaxID=3064888 RepID=A0ABT9E7A5_9PROT|nr:2Fe-2S iron-sulfur cluster-binding protein [Paracraurococcus sp. LOR1-02]MDO9712072.1 2Fe-2S iron-sulfur cluster-binding protein [Paracraurococcus sp. LOR1-02]
MARITFIQPDGTRQAFESGEDETVMLVGVRHNVPRLPADCGGQLACASCMVDVPEPWRERVGGPGLDEGDMIEDALGARPVGRRLSCQIRITDALDGLEVALPEAQG